MKNLTGLLCLALLAACGGKAPEGKFEAIADGVIVTPASDANRRVRVQVLNGHIARVTAVAGNFEGVPKSLMVVGPPPQESSFEVDRKGDEVTVTATTFVAHVSLANGAVTFTDKDGKALLAEQPVQAWPEKGVSRRFNPGTDEGLFGSGQHQNAQLDLNGEDVELAQHNMDIAVPFIVSTRNYGVLWDNNGITRIGNPQPYGLASRDLKVLDASGKEGGFTATYSIAGEKKVERIEKDINYQYIRDRSNWPKELLTGQEPATGSPPNILPSQAVTWVGSLVSEKAGVHKFQLYGSSYFKVWVDGNLVLDRWRQNWAAWYHNFDVPMVAGTPLKVKIEWIPEGGYLALLHSDPLPDAERHSLTFTSDVGRAVDYYFVAGANSDEVIAGYRELTGKAVMMPRWAYGFWQSRQRYTTQKELVDVVAEYRRRKIPLDNIVLDWFYWKEDQWGSHEFDQTRFPDPKGMLDAVHAQHAQLMISVWPKFYPGTANYQELDKAGFMYHGNVEAGAKDWVGPGYTNSFYDPYSKAARDMYWRQVNERLNVLGIDAWWMDATEPDLHSNLDLDSIKARIGPTAMGPAENFFNSYPLVHSGGVYEGAREANQKRVFILTRSGFGGLQRNAAAVWSGDIASRWDDLYNQISSGVSVSYSGLPNWTYDIGGFANEGRYSTQKPKPEDVAEWRELNLRWFQMGAFAPLFRSHGEYPLREIFNLAPEGSEVFNSLVWYDKLRYRLLPYTYTLAADTYHRDGTILRGLAMDFPDDKTTRVVRDEYLFGKAFLVAPVHKYQARTRVVYLPAGADWYDFHTGARHVGGQGGFPAAAPLARMPLFVRAGSIVPVGPDVQYAAEKPNAPITLLVFTGADGNFDYYEDDGVSYGYEKGEFARIPLRYDAAKGTLTLGARTGSYPGMREKQIFWVRWIKPGAKAPADLDAKPDITIPYDGREVTVNQ